VTEVKVEIPEATLEVVNRILKKNPWLAYDGIGAVLLSALKAWIIKHRDLDRPEWEQPPG